MATGHAHPTEDAAVLPGASRTRMGGEPAAERGFTLEVPSPFRLDLTVWALRRRAHNAMDRFDGRYDRRT